METPIENVFILLRFHQTMPEKCNFQTASVPLYFMMANAGFPILLLIYKYGRDLGRNQKTV